MTLGVGGDYSVRKSDSPQLAERRKSALATDKFRTSVFFFFFISEVVYIGSKFSSISPNFILLISAILLHKSHSYPVQKIMY